MSDKVIEIQLVLILGAYAPLTKVGNIIVDGVLASCYAYFDHDMAHFMVTPMQWFPEILQCIFGMGIGLPVIVTMMREMAMVMLPAGQIFNPEINRF